MVIEVLKKGIIQFKDESYYQYTEEKESNWIFYPKLFEDLNNELDKYDNNFTATVNLKNGGTKKISIFEIKRFVNDANSGKIKNKNSATDRY